MAYVIPSCKMSENEARFNSFLIRW